MLGVGPPLDDARSATNRPRCCQSSGGRRRRGRSRGFPGRLGGILGHVHEQLVVQAQDDLGTELPGRGPDGGSPGLEQLGSGALDHGVAREPPRAASRAAVCAALSALPVVPFASRAPH